MRIRTTGYDLQYDAALIVLGNQRLPAPPPLPAAARVPVAAVALPPQQPPPPPAIDLNRVYQQTVQQTRVTRYILPSLHLN